MNNIYEEMRIHNLIIYTIETKPETWIDQKILYIVKDSWPNCWWHLYIFWNLYLSGIPFWYLVIYYKFLYLNPFLAFKDLSLSVSLGLNGFKLGWIPGTTPVWKGQSSEKSFRFSQPRDMLWWLPQSLTRGLW